MYQTKAWFVLLARADFSVCLLCLRCIVCGVLFPCFCCQYQCNRLPGKTCPQNHLVCVECDIIQMTHDGIMCHLFCRITN